MTAADALVRRLFDHGVRHIFGYPGGQMTPLYDALHRHGGIRHYLARHEQAAAFMADGFARATGRPGVCLAVCGPGVYNAATPLATAFTDSVPFLLISGQVPRAGRGLRSGFYHENAQLDACATLTRARGCGEGMAAVVSEVDRLWREMTSGRPGPALLEVPVDVLRDDVPDAPWPALPPPTEPPAPSPADVAALARLVGSWRRPLILAGGGVVSAGGEAALRRVAERLGAPVFHTAMGKCAFPTAHPLSAGLPWFKATSDLTNMANFFSPLFAEADGLLAVGCRFSQLATGSWSMPRPPALAHIDIDPTELGRHYPPTCAVAADARLALEALAEELPVEPRPPWAPRRPNPEPWRLPGVEALEAMRRALPRDTIVVADITRLAYILMADYPLSEPRTFLHPAGFVAMGYGLPAALGAKAALPERTVVTVVGDGCFQMCGLELATMVQEKLPVVVIVVNDGSLSLIKAIQQRRYEERYLGVDLLNPDFARFARAYGVASWRATDDASFETALREAVALGAPALVELRIA